jgi:hypothetical protein
MPPMGYAELRVSALIETCAVLDTPLHCVNDLKNRITE